MIKVLIDEQDLLEMLIDRLNVWTDDKDVINLYSMYYENMINCGCFDGMELNIMVIVDNDYVNYLEVITADEFDNWDIESPEDERIEVTDGRFYLIRTC